jgi:hypothetical protein
MGDTLALLNNCIRPDVATLFGEFSALLCHTCLTSLHGKSILTLEFKAISGLKYFFLELILLKTQFKWLEILHLIMSDLKSNGQFSSQNQKSTVDPLTPGSHPALDVSLYS